VSNRFKKRPASEASAQSVLERRQRRHKMMLLINRTNAPAHLSQFLPGHLAYIFVIEVQCAAGGTQGCVEQSEQSGFARSGRAQERDSLKRQDLKGQPVQRSQRPVARLVVLCYVLERVDHFNSPASVAAWRSFE